MARPQKDGLDYFPLDVDIDQDEKVALIEAQHGPIGFSIIIKIFMKIYRNGYFYEWGEKEQLLFSKQINVDINLINDVINDGLKWGLFNKEVYESKGILTSKGIQKRYLEATGRRNRTNVIDDYCLLSEEELNVYKNIVIVNVNGKTVKVINYINPQSKVKESKVNKSKEINNQQHNPRFAEIETTLIENGFGMSTGVAREEITETLINGPFEEPIDIIIEAIKEAARNNKKAWTYVRRVLIAWEDKGVKKKNDAIAIIKQWEQDQLNKKNNRSSNRGKNINEASLPKWMSEGQKEPEQEVTPHQDKLAKDREKELEEFLNSL